MADQIRKERIRSACLQCQKRKKRCDGGKPSCANCSKLNASCHYEERRPRGPGRKNNRVEQLETRLKSLESALQLHEPAPNSMSEDRTTEYVQPVQLQSLRADTTGDSLLHNHSAPIEPAQNHVLGAGESQVDLEISNLTETNPNPPLANFEAQQPPSPAQIISKYSEFTDSIKSAYHWIRGQENRGVNQSRLFARLPTYEQVRNLVEPIVEHLQQHGAAITTESWVKLVDQQYSADPDSYVDDPARWAIVNSFFATAMLNRSTTDFLAEVLPTAWSYFKNAFSMFPELITHGKDVSACEGLVAMAMFTQCTADAQLITQITAALTCLVKTLGLHRKRFYHLLDPIAVQRHQRIFWVAYILEVDAMEKYDMSPSLGNEELGEPFEHDASSTEYTDSEKFSSVDVLRWRAELAVIQKRIYEGLHDAKYQRIKRNGLPEAVASLDEQLRAWKSTLPEKIWAMAYHDDEQNFPSSIALLQCAFFNSMSKVHMAIAHLKAADRLQHEENMASGQSYSESEIKNSRTTSAVSARNIISVVVKLAAQPYFQLWGTFAYPLSAVLILFSVILESPASATAQDDAPRIAQFVNFLKKLAADGCDVQRLLNSCIKIQDVASCAISTSQAQEHAQSKRVALGRSITLSQLESIRAKLSNVEDWLQLSQGLLSNLPLLRMEAEEVLSGISGFSTPQGIYGSCVPELLKSQNYHISSGG